MDYTFTPCSCHLLLLWRLSNISHTHSSVYTLRKSTLSKRVIQHVNAISQTQTEEVWLLYLLVLKCQKIGCCSFIDWSTFSPTEHFSCEEKGYMKKRFFHLFHSNSDQLSGIKKQQHSPSVLLITANSYYLPVPHNIPMPFSILDWGICLFFSSFSNLKKVLWLSSLWRTLPHSQRDLTKL